MKKIIQEIKKESKLCSLRMKKCGSPMDWYWLGVFAGYEHCLELLKEKKPRKKKK